MMTLQAMDITIMGKRTFEEIQDLQDVESFYQATETMSLRMIETLPVSNLPASSWGCGGLCSPN